MLHAMNPVEIEEALRPHPGWTSGEGCIHREFRFPTYMDGIRFVEAVAVEAEALDHHPDLLVKYAEVRVFLSTHSVGGVTFKDFELASRVDAAFAAFERG